MSAKLLGINQVKKVTKPWGWEKWIADDSFPYVLKEIFIKAPHQSSLQIHQEKYETVYVMEGSGWLHMHSEDIPDWDSLNETEIERFIRTIYRMPIQKGSVFHVAPGEIHRVVAAEDLRLIEASTCELDDVIRLEDSSNRPHGRIESEHG